MPTTSSPAAIEASRLKETTFTKRSNFFYLLIVTMFGFYQIIVLSIQYFDYGTVTQSTITLELPITPPAVQMCLMVSSISQYPKSMNHTRSEYDAMTVEDLLSFVPNSSESVAWCYFHRHDSYLSSSQ